MPENKKGTVIPMKRFVICGFIVLVLVILGAGSLYYTETTTREAEDTIEEISLSFGRGEFDQTKSLSRKLSADWEKYNQNHFFMTDKEHVMELSSVIARVHALAEEEDPDLTVECAVARELMASYRIKNTINWSNIF